MRRAEEEIERACRGEGRVGAGERASLLPLAAATFFSTLVVVAFSSPTGARAPILPRPLPRPAALALLHLGPLCASASRGAPPPASAQIRRRCRASHPSSVPQCQRPPCSAPSTGGQPRGPEISRATARQGVRRADATPTERTRHRCILQPNSPTQQLSVSLSPFSGYP
jgi:hypothetical protein